MPNDRRSLLDIASGGQYKTSKELPSFSDLLSVIAEYQSKEMSKEVGYGVTQGDLYEIATGAAGLAGFGRGIGKVASTAVKQLRSIQKLKIQKGTIENLSKHSMSKEGASELKKISLELDNYLGPQRSARIVKQGGNVNAPSIRKLDRKKYKSFEERLDALSKKEGGVVRVEYEKGLDFGKSQTAKSLTSKQRIEREKLKEQERLFQELGGSQRGRSRKGVF